MKKIPLTSEMLLREPFETLEHSWYPKETPQLALAIDVTLAPPFQLGIGVKVFKGSVFVSGYKLDDAGFSACKSAGLRVGDQVEIIYYRK